MMRLVVPRVCARALFVAALFSPGSLLAKDLSNAGPAIVDGFVYVPSGEGGVACLPPLAVGAPLLAATLAALDEVELDPQFAVILTAKPLSCASIYYVPVKNDVAGIGYQRSGDSERFDDAPERRLEGIVFLNDLPYWLNEPEELKAAFLHELGHRWLTRVHARVDGEDISLTGRDDEHWSYFLDAGASPLEGNLWSEDMPPFSTAPRYPLSYTPLDLYLMGALGPDEVPPFRLLDPDAEAGALLDCDGRRLSRASAPQRCDPLAVPGSFRTITIDDVIDAEGPRQPSAEDAPRSFSVAFLMLDEERPSLSSESCASFSRLTGELIEVFSDATDARLRLESATPQGSSCAELEPAPPPPAQGCATSGPGSSRAGSSHFARILLFLVVGLVGVGRRFLSREQARRPSPGLFSAADRTCARTRG